MPHHVRTHLRLKKDHRLAFWCDPHRQVEDAQVTSRWDPARYNRVDPLVADLGLIDTQPAALIGRSVDWRRQEIARLEDEIVRLQEIAQSLGIPARDVA